MKTTTIKTEHENISEINLGDKLLLNNDTEVEVILLLDNTEEKTFFLSWNQLKPMPKEEISIYVAKYNYDLTHCRIKEWGNYSELDIIKKIN